MVRVVEKYTALEKSYAAADKKGKATAQNFAAMSNLAEKVATLLGSS